MRIFREHFEVYPQSRRAMAVMGKAFVVWFLVPLILLAALAWMPSENAFERAMVFVVVAFNGWMLTVFFICGNDRTPEDGV